jgi:hypothetical protein
VALFTSLYEVFIGENPDYPEYREGIFSSVGLLTFLLGAVAAAIFYVALGRWKPVFEKPVHWVITLVLTALIGFLLAYTQARGTLGATDSYTTRFALFNALYAVVYFFLFSILFKRFSIFARHTPFKF